MSDYNDRWKALQEKHPDLQKVLDDPAVKKAGEYYEMDQRWQLTVPEELWSKYKVERGQPIPESVMTPYDAARWKSAHDPLNDSRSSTDLTKAIDRATRMLNRTLDDSAKFSESDVVDIGEHLRVEAAIRAQDEHDAKYGEIPRGKKQANGQPIMPAAEWKGTTPVKLDTAYHAPNGDIDYVSKQHVSNGPIQSGNERTRS